MMSVGNVVTSAARFRLKVRVTSVRVPPTGTWGNASKAPVDLSRISTPITEMALGSVACTSTLSATSTRTPTVCVTEGGVTSFAADWMFTVTVLLVPRRPAESSAKPTTTNDPVVASTRSVSV